MRLVVTGAGGQLGADLLELATQDARVAALQGFTKAELDITEPARVRAVVGEQARPAKAQGGLVIINAAAWTDVDGAEADEGRAFAANALAPGLLAAACAEVGARLIQVSTDYVFPGDASKPYETDTPTGPRSAYGRTKLAGEQAVRELHPGDSYVVRTAWVYGASGGNFVKTMARLERERETISVVDDQRGSPTWSRDLAAGLLDLAATETVPPGVLHATSSGDVTWCGFAKAIFSELGADPSRVAPCSTADFPRPAPRPAYSVLSGGSWAAAGLAPLPHWQAALGAAFAAIGPLLRG